MVLQFVPRVIRYFKSSGWYDDQELKKIISDKLEDKGGNAFSYTDRSKPICVCVTSEKTTKVFSTASASANAADVHLIDTAAVSTSQVILASNALRSYFSPQIIDIGGKLRTFADGSLVCNNPVFEALLESKRARGRHLPHIVVSIGTGEPNTSKKCSLSTPFGNKPVDIPLFSQSAHEAFIKHVPAVQQAGSTLRYERFNPPNLHVTAMDTSNVDVLNKLKAGTAEYLRHDAIRTRMHSAAQALLGVSAQPPVTIPTLNLSSLLPKPA
jgi:predicted acylesterase/phospholipase RssA